MRVVDDDGERPIEDGIEALFIEFEAFGDFWILYPLPCRVDS